MSGPDQSLCTFVWEAAATDPHSKSIYRLGIFDINRWYHAQMPFSIRLVDRGKAVLSPQQGLSGEGYRFSAAAKLTTARV